MQYQFAQIREAFDLRQPFVLETDTVKKMVAERQYFQSRNARQKAQILASVAPAIGVAIPERSGQMKFFEIAKRAEAFQIPDLIRTKINLLPEGIAEVRTIEIVGLDLQADGGTHVANTREVGHIRVVDYQSKGKINKRIYIAVEA